jgi:hypothetical protein
MSTLKTNFLIFHKLANQDISGIRDPVPTSRDTVITVECGFILPQWYGDNNEENNNNSYLWDVIHRYYQI